MEQLLPALEALNVRLIAHKAKQARLPASMASAIVDNAAWSKKPETALAVKGIEYAAPKVAAKWLTRFGVPSGSQDEIVLATSLITLVTSQALILKRLDKLIEVANVPAAKPKGKTPSDQKS